MRFGILGTVEARHPDGQLDELGSPKLRALLTLLLLDAGRVVPTERLIDGVYGESPPRSAANALQSQVSRLRRRLPSDSGGTGPVEFHPGGYRIAVDPAEVDAHQFEELAARGRSALADGDHAGAARLLGEGLALWRGPALDDLDASSPARAAAHRLDELRQEATEDHAEAELALGRHRELLPRLRELVAARPLRERPRALLVRALTASDQRAEALSAFEDARTTLAEELGTDPSAELGAAHLDALSGAPPTVAISSLPAQVSSFVGRQDELDRLGTLLGDQRLVTLTGMGGTGKTRLAVEAARASGDAEVCFVELASVADGESVAQAVVAALGLRESGVRGQPATDRLVAALDARPMLLTLDNCEHVVDATAQLAARLLAACPTLRVLATSREPLGITGEALFPIAGLPVPPAGTDDARAREYPAVRLFTDRATAGRPGLNVDDTGTLADVRRVCEELDGLPLAIELAAARVRSMSVAEVAARLHDRFALLSRGSRTADARHRTLRAVVLWSWDLLEPGERELARRMAVFTGGATLAAAEWVCAVADVLDPLTGLADKSLVEVHGDRYGMLETVRAFCAERLDAAGETESVRRAHAQCFLALAQSAEPHLRGAGQLAWLDRLDAERENIDAALRWATGADTTLALRMAGALSLYWWLRGRRAEGALRCRELADAVGPHPPEGLREEYLLCVLTALSGAADRSPLRPHIEAVNALAREWRGAPRHPVLAVLWALLTGPAPDEGAALLSPPEDLLGPDAWSRALEPLSTGLRELHQGRVDDAERSLTDALRRFRANGERWGLTQTLAELCALPSWRGEHARALALVDEAIELCRELGAVEETADLLGRRAACRARAGDLDGARADCERAIEVARRTGSGEIRAGAHVGLAELALVRGDPAEVRRLCEEALEECPDDWLGPQPNRLRAFVTLGRVAAANGERVEARAWYRRALDRSAIHVAANAVEGLAGIALAEGRAERAARLLGAGVALRGTTVAGATDAARTATAARERIGAEAFDAAHGAGAAMTHDEALTLAGAPPSTIGA